MRLDFVTVDVFTDDKVRRQSAGRRARRPRALDGEQMQSIAAEFNLRRDDLRAAAARRCAYGACAHFHAARRNAVRRPSQCRHGFCARRRRQSRADRRPLTVRGESRAWCGFDLIKDGGAVAGATLEPPQPLSRGEAIAPDLIATACSLDVADIETSTPRALHRLLRRRLSSSPSSRRAQRSPRRGRAAEIFARAMSKPISRPASCSMSKTEAAASIFRRACSRRSMACPKTPRPAAPMSRWSAYWRACAPSAI